MAHYFSRSRKSIWLKGESSGMFHNIKNMFIDDDQDCLILEVELTKTKQRRKASILPCRLQELLLQKNS